MVKSTRSWVTQRFGTMISIKMALGMILPVNWMYRDPWQVTTPVIVMIWMPIIRKQEKVTGQDNNCDNTIDDDDPLIISKSTFYEDLDTDGVGSSLSQFACLQPSGFVSTTGDCNDLDNTVYLCSRNLRPKDNTCDGLVDDNDPLIVGQTTFYQDLDADGVGSNVTSTVCFVPSGYVSITGDCDDSNVAIYTGAAEVCDGLDNDCDGATDDADSDVIGQTTYYEDGDTDGFGSGVSQTVCFQPNGYVTSTGIVMMETFPLIQTLLKCVIR